MRQTGEVTPLCTLNLYTKQVSRSPTQEAQSEVQFDGDFGESVALQAISSLRVLGRRVRVLVECGFGLGLGYGEGDRYGSYGPFYRGPTNCYNNFKTLVFNYYLKLPFSQIKAYPAY